MEPSKQVHRLDADQLYREEVLRARRQTPAQKILAGFQLFELACEFTKAGIRAERPEAEETEVLEILRQRLALARRLEDAS